MKSKHITILLTSLLVFPAMAKAGEWVNGSVSNAAGSRQYQLWLPSLRQTEKTKTGERAHRDLPLVMMLHGCLQKPQDLAEISGMNLVADKNEFLVVYPEQTREANPLACWNWFDPRHQERGQGEPSLLAALVQEVATKHQVDRRRVYVAGISAGAAMAVVMGVTYPDLFSGIGVMAGLAYKAGTTVESGMAAMKQGAPNPKQLGLLAFQAMPAGNRTRRMPVIVFHGLADPYLNPVNADQVIAQWAQTNDYLDDNSDNDSTRAEPRRTFADAVPGGHSYTRDVYGDRADRLLMERWLIKDLGHAWSGSPAAAPFADPKGPDAAAEMWRFFEEVTTLRSDGRPPRRRAATPQRGTR
jgi:poly(hydroxyalkanoate) depolymerase family esterase